MRITCRELARWIAAEELAEAGLVRRVRARLHLRICPPCREYEIQIRAVGAAARSAWSAAVEDEALSHLEEECLALIAGRRAGPPA